MKKLINIAILWFIILPVFSQPNVSDSLKRLLNQNISDSEKIDKLNSYIFRFAPIQPELVLLYSDTAIELSERIKDSSRLALSVNRKGVALFYMGDYYASLESYFRALSIKENSGNRDDLWREYNNIGLVLRNLDQNFEALKFFNMALALILETGDKKSEAILWNNIGICYRGLNKFGEAKRSIEKADSINIAIGAEQAIAQDLNNLGNIYKDLKKYNVAIDYYLKSLTINRVLYNKYEQVQNLNNLSDSYISLGQFDKSRRYLTEAEGILGELRTDQLKLNNLSLFSLYYAKTGKFEQALLYKNRYVNMRNSIDSLSRVKQFNQLKTLANAEKEIQELEFLKKINSLQAEKIANQKFIQVASGLVIMLILSILYVVLRNLKIKKDLNISLNKQSAELTNLNEELQTANEELQSANEELNSQREELEGTLESLQQAQEHLIKSEKMASLGVLAAGVAHEINNPLNFIQGGVIGLETYFEENLQDHIINVNPMINGIQVGISRAAAIVTSLNHYSRHNNLSGTDCNIHSIIDNCLVMLQSETKNRIEIQKEFAIDAGNIIGNEGKLHQAILNILANACQAIEDHGTITITTKSEPDKLVVKIKDTGSGISDENKTKIMDPFFTTKPMGKGTGLGLSITYNIIQEHNGTIEYQSQLGKGTTFIISLPVNNIVKP